MKSLVAYDSYFGNTQKIAEAIADTLGDNCKIVQISNLDKKQLEGTNLFILGSPIRGWQATENTMAFLNSLDKNDLKGIKATTFDTRVKLFIHGDAMGKMAKTLETKGAKIICEPMPFYVSGTEGPLLEGEIEKAVEWAKKIKNLQISNG